MKCSVLLPVYNAGKPLRAAIESILLQDEADFEFLIIDDCSKDGSPSLIRSLAARDRRIRPIFHRTNAGLAHTLNEGLHEARGELVARMDQDDIALPNRISTQVRFLRSRPRVAVAGSFVYHMGRTLRLDRLVRVPTDHGEITNTLARQNCLYHPSVMLRRDSILALDGYRSEFHNSEDYDLWLRASRAFELANIPVPLLRYRFSAGGMTLGKKWHQMLYTQMAMVSHRNPEWTIQQVRERAEVELDEIGRDAFLLAVAQGTVEELLQLGRWGAACSVFCRFFRQLSPTSAKQLVSTAGRSLSRLENAWPRTDSQL
jgi:hypothetical protein